MPTKCTSCSNEAGEGKRQCSFHLAVSIWHMKRSRLTAQGKNESLAGPRPEARHFICKPFGAPAKESPKPKTPSIAQVVAAAAVHNGHIPSPSEAEVDEAKDRIEFAKEPLRPKISVDLDDSGDDGRSIDDCKRRGDAPRWEGSSGPIEDRVRTKVNRLQGEIHRLEGDLIRLRLQERVLLEVIDPELVKA